MRLLCFIDYLGSGGAQRQLTFLARHLKKSGVDVEVLTYHESDFFIPVLAEAGINVETVRGGGRFTKVFSLRKSIRARKFDVLLAFLNAPALYAEIAALPRRRWGLVVSERLAVPGSSMGFARFRRYLHGLADYVTTNSHTNRLLIEKAVPGLTGKVVTIYNALDLEYFSPLQGPVPAGDGRLRFVVLASHQLKKNLLGLVEAAHQVVQAAPELDFTIEWFGRFDAGKNGPGDTGPFEQAKRRIETFRIQDRFIFREPTSDVAAVYRRADALILPSFYEGLPNVVCEAMACGRPVLMSNVCDAENLVREGDNGFLFDPRDPADMARAILRFAALSGDDRKLMGEKSRKRAVILFNPERFAAHYRRVLESAMRREQTIIPHWCEAIPQSAIRMIENEK